MPAQIRHQELTEIEGEVNRFLTGCPPKSRIGNGYGLLAEDSPVRVYRSTRLGGANHFGGIDDVAMTREDLISSLRSKLLRHAGDDRSICRAAAENGCFCHGFSRFTNRELRRRMAWIARKSSNATREELEQIIDRWQLARQEYNQLSTACDVQCREHDLCNGWDDFSDEELARFDSELT